MRGAFNVTCTVRYGARSLTGAPGTVRALAVPCRRVEQDEIFQLEFPGLLTEAWVTLDALLLDGPYTISPWLGATYTDYEAADVIEFSDRPNIWYVVMRTESVEPVGRAPYYRWLILLVDDIDVPPWQPQEPIPPDPTAPNVVPPASTCASAPLVPFATPVSSGLMPDGQSWWLLPLVGGYEYHFTLLTQSDPPGTVSANVGQCGAQAAVFVTNAVGCVTFTLGENEACYLERSGQSGTMSFRVDNGPCPG